MRLINGGRSRSRPQRTVRNYPRTNEGSSDVDEKIGYLPLSISGFAKLSLSTLASQKCHPVRMHFDYHAIFSFFIAFIFIFYFLAPERTEVPL